MNRKILFVMKDVFQTRFMQAADMFEKFKFIGSLLELTQAPSHHHLTAKQVLERASKSKQECKGQLVVGVIIPNISAAFLPEHTVYSNGGQWITVEDMCKGMGAALE
jgi:hypothetical protein